jgi:hypothetical protein
MRKATRLALTALTLAVTTSAALSGCSAIQPEIDRVSIDPYWEKSDFVNDDSWYYSTTVVEGAPNGYLYAGDTGFIVMERLKWEVTENHLIGWRDYAAAPGTEIDALEGGEDAFKGQPIAMYAISGHFDIRHTYDTLTGELSNEIVENTERPWHEREYFRVNWSQNLVPSWNSHHTFSVMTPYGPVAANTYAVEYDDVGDPRRWRFERNEDGELEYIELVSRTTVAPDIYAIVGFYGPGRFLDLAPTVADIRHSFMKVKDSDYIPLAYPDSVVVTDEMGEEVRDPETGLAQRTKVFDRFGFFTTWNRQVWDPERGFTKISEQNYAIRFNTWEQNKDSMGNPLPFADRNPKPMHWYTNFDHPKQLLHAAQRVADEWNLVFKDMVFEARNLSAQELGRDAVYASRDDVPDMFILHENDCNPSNVQSFLAGLPPSMQSAVQTDAKDYNFDGTIESVVERYDWANSYENHTGFNERQNLETQAVSDLARICSALEWHTGESRPEDYTGERFRWQRAGDIRYNMINGIVEKAPAPWLGVATILADPLTGEEIKATANIGLGALDNYAFRSNEAIKILNGEVDLDDVLFGYDIESYVREKLINSRALMTYSAGQNMKDKMDARFAELGRGESALRDVSPDYAKARLSRLQDTHIEDLILSDETMMAYGQVDPLTLEQFDGDLDAATLDRASPLRNWEQSGPRAEEARFARMGERAMDPVELLDQFAIGANMLYRNIENDRLRFEKIREDLYVGTQLHEVGHTLALRHNFEASSDALNYGRSFWEIQQLSPDLDDALGQVDPTGDHYETIQACIDFQQQLRVQEGDPTLVLTTQECLAQNQQMYSTIMEYNGHWTADAGGCLEGCGLGPYDYAAIKFGYAQMLQQFNRPTTDRTEQEIIDFLHYNDWRDIPSDLVVDVDAIMDRSYFFWDWNVYSTNQELPANTVPFRFCTDNGYDTPTCNRWDWGPDSRYNMAYGEYSYYQRYFFTHFARDRYWDINGNGWRSAFNNDWRTMAQYTQKMQWYQFYKTLDPNFEGTYLEEDLLATTINGLNHFMHVLGHPASGDYIEVPLAYVEGLTNTPPSAYANDDDRLVPSGIMRKWDYLGYCDSIYFTSLDSAERPTGGQNGYAFGKVPLGDGRPFAIGSTNTDSIEWVISYVGTYFTKELAFQEMAYPFAWFPAVDMTGTDPRNYNISWYRLFPEEVGGIIHDFVTEQYADLGPLIDNNGNLIYRDIIDPVTGERPDYSGYKRITPSVSFNHQYYSALYSLAWMSDLYDGQYDMSKSFIIAVEGANDDIGLFDQLASDPETADQLVEFDHPVTGRRIRAVDAGPNPIGADMVRRLNVLKERYEVLDGCVQGTIDPSSNPYCKCTESTRAQTDIAGELQLYCNEPYLETPGQGVCGQYELENRRDRAREIMDDMQDFIEDVRFIKNIFEN